MKMIKETRPENDSNNENPTPTITNICVDSPYRGFRYEGAFSENRNYNRLSMQHSFPSINKPNSNWIPTARAISSKPPIFSTFSRLNLTAKIDHISLGFSPLL